MINKILNKIKPGNIKYKVMPCPKCRQRLRYPIKPNTTIRISCPKCKSQFDIDFVNPFSDLFKWNSKISIISNLNNSKNMFKKLPRNSKRSLILLVISIFFMIFFLIMSIINQPTDMEPKKEIINKELTL